MEVTFVMPIIYDFPKINSYQWTLNTHLPNFLLDYLI